MKFSILAIFAASLLAVNAAPAPAPLPLPTAVAVAQPTGAVEFIAFVARAPLVTSLPIRKRIEVGSSGDPCTCRSSSHVYGGTSTHWTRSCWWDGYEIYVTTNTNGNRVTVSKSFWGNGYTTCPFGLVPINSSQAPDTN